jgi:predicted membrane protein
MVSASASLSRWGIGIALVVVGTLLLLSTTGVVELGDLIRWTPSLLILLGILMMVANRFRRNVGPAILIAVGVVVQLIVLDFDVVSLLWPVLIILIGVAILFSRGRRSSRTTGEQSARFADVDFSTVLGSTDRRVSPDDLNGQEIVTVMGESKLDMRDISITDLPAELCVTCVMGQVNIRVPSDWSVAINNSTVMGDSKDDRRGASSSTHADLTITGTVVMGSLKIDD